MQLATAETYLPAELVLQARADGQKWGEQEVECWRDQHDGSFDRAPEWTMGTWAGSAPAGLTEEQYDAYDLIIDAAARDVWEAERDAS